MKIEAQPARAAGTGDLEVRLINTTARPLTVLIDDLAYGNAQRVVELSSSGSNLSRADVRINLNRSFGCYHLQLRVKGEPRFEQRYAGHVESGRESFSDPRIGAFPA